jgi:putative flippase GtrA
MIAMLNVGRFLMVLWVIYGVVVIFAPQYVHQQKNPISGLIQCVCAYVVGYLLDRQLSKARRQKAAESEPVAPENSTI